MQLLAPFAVLALLAVPAIVALYFLKVRRPQRPVSSLLFWRQQTVDRQANAPWQRLRTSLLLALQLLVAVALAFALMRPGFAKAPTVASTTIVLLDGSPSMLATDVKPNRFSVALDATRGMTNDVGGGREMAVVLLGNHARVLAPPTSDRGKLKRALGDARAPAQRANLAEGISLANSLLAGRPGGEVVLVSDGHFDLPSPAPKVAAPLRFWSVGATGDNVGIESISRQGEGVVALRVANLGRDRRDVEVELRADGELVDVLPVGIDGNESVDLDWAGLQKGTGVLEARLGGGGDAFPLDDGAWLVTEDATPRRVQLVTAGNGFLQRALQLRGDLDVTVVKPAEYTPGPYDLYVFDGFVPAGELPHPALVIAPPRGEGPLPADEVADPGELLPPDPRDPLLRYVSLKDVHVQSSARVAPLPGWRPVIAAANGPLLLVTKDEPRLAQMTFDIHNSDLPLRPAFPVLVQNLVTHLLGGSFANQTFELGQPVRLVAEEGAQGLDVRGPDGFRATLKPPFAATLEDTARPGVYTVRQVGLPDDLTRQFVLQLDVPQQSRIDPGAGPAVETGPGRPGQAPPSTAELWPWLAALALVVVGAEWLVFLRR